jgi:hypothetical protein
LYFVQLFNRFATVQEVVGVFIAAFSCAAVLVSSL